MTKRFCRFFAFLACIAAGQALAGVTLLSPTPQRVKIGETIAPIQLRVTDAAGNPVANEGVRYEMLPSGLIDVTSDMNCFFGGVRSCTVFTDAQGVATTHPFKALKASTQPANVYFDVGFTLFAATAQIFVDPVVPPMTLSVVSGANQRAVLGTAFANPFVVQVLTPSGSLVSGARVIFYSASGAALDFGGAFFTSTTTNANGQASASLRIATGIGPGVARAQVTDPVANMDITVDIPFTSTAPDGRSDLSLQNLWWSGSQQNGWGLSLAQRGDRLFPVLFVYDENGNPTWRLIANGMWESSARYERYAGFSFKPKGTPYYAYDASRLNFNVFGTLAKFDFHSDVAGSIDVVEGFNNGHTVKSIAPMDFGQGVPPRMPGVGGMWWGGPSQAGWGISLMEQPAGMFAVWFTYDANGDPTWFVMPTGTWENDSTYSGTLYRTRSSPWFETTYDSSRLQVTPVGTFRYRWTNVNNATFEWTAEGHAGSMGLVRFEF